MNAGERDAVIFTGSGCTGAVSKLVNALGCIQVANIRFVWGIQFSGRLNCTNMQYFQMIFTQLQIILVCYCRQVFHKFRYSYSIERKYICLHPEASMLDIKLIRILVAGLCGVCKPDGTSFEPSALEGGRG